ncbi:methanogenesis marker 16 metalloprotein [Candidatus Methanomassiliicoccus intestinalis]|uniref:methanogenesis marker 16 metalloprotein n=1 Tax=Candidatus Methanomassiliicoccus intestinalis TaxID=1406512 RepID=UPI0037DCF94A
MIRTFKEIKEKLANGDAVVMTAQEIKSCTMAEASKADVVTTGTRGLMSGTYAVFSIPLKHSKFSRAVSLKLNDVPAHPGPCPNENLNLIEAIVLGTSSSNNYGAGMLFRDMLEGKTIHVEAVSKEGNIISDDVLFEDIPYAKLMATRNAFRNYSAMTNPHDYEISTIFNAHKFATNYQEITFSGCGSLNPLQNDPHLKTIGIGTKVLINGAEGFVMGTGTRATAQAPNLTVCADMKGMNPEYLGGFLTSAGPECIVSWAVPIPILDETILADVRATDDQIVLPIADVSNRKTIAYADYGQAWSNRSLSVKVYPAECEKCAVCKAAAACPTFAISQIPSIDRHKCFNCGLCSTICSKVFSADLGTISFRINDNFKEIPITCRQSDRLRALQISKELKTKLLNGSFTLTEPVEKLQLS